ncbi:MAG TPA: HAD family phosphatase [Bacteroidia bacterium]|nr:HAD family phosphatase [Bacteroidia bacterium]
MLVKNIILDFGGVLLDIDYQLTEQAFIKLGCTNFREIYSQAAQTSLFNKFETGVISEVVFFDELKKLSGIKNLSVDEIRDAWNAMLIGFPVENYLLLKELQKKYRVFLLSNTNETHITEFEKLLERVCPVSEFENLFEKVYYSCRMNLRKPDTACFLQVLNDNKLKLEETIFIDDSIQHIEGAKKVGITVHFLEKGLYTKSLLQNLNLL